MSQVPTCVRFSLIPVCLCQGGSYCATFDYCSRVVLLYSDVCIGHCIRYDISSISGLFKSDFICDPVLYLGLSIYMFLLNQHSLFCNVIVNMNEIPYFKAYLISTLAGLVLSCILCAYFKLGTWGLVLGQMLPQLAYNNWYWPVYVMKKLSLPIFLQSLPVCNGGFPNLRVS